jgi:hypothetical protein
VAAERRERTAEVIVRMQIVDSNSTQFEVVFRKNRGGSCQLAEVVAFFGQQMAPHHEALAVFQIGRLRESDFNAHLR